MLWVYRHYKYLKSFSAEIDLRRQILTSIVGLGAERVQPFFCLIIGSHVSDNLIWHHMCICRYGTFKQCHELKKWLISQTEEGWRRRSMTRIIRWRKKKIRG